MPPTANCVLSVADDAGCAAAVGLETDCGTLPSHATVARLAVIINTAHVRVMVPRFHRPTWPLSPLNRRRAVALRWSGRATHSSKSRAIKEMRFVARAQKDPAQVVSCPLK